MTIDLTFRKNVSRIAALLLCLMGVGAVTGFALTQFAFAALTDPRLPVSRDLLLSAARYFPNSSRVHARLAAHMVEAEVNSALSHEQVAEAALYHATRAIKSSPRSYEVRVISALVKEAQGDLMGAESDLRAALTLAFHHLGLRWRLANLLVRAGKLDQAISELQTVNAGTSNYLSDTMHLVWQASDGDVGALRSAIGDHPASMPGARIALARFLASQSQFDAGADIFRSLSRGHRLDSLETPRFLDELLAANRVQLAAELWGDLFDTDAKPNQILWNGSFETTIRKGITQFDWNLAQSRFARVALSDGVARSGRRALEIAYLGVDTTRLDHEIRQLVPVHPGGRYRLEAFARTDGLMTPNAPRIVIISSDSKSLIAASPLVAIGSHDWQSLSLEFTAPANSPAVILAIKQDPQFSYVEPTRGTVWFDDFTLQQK